MSDFIASFQQNFIDESRYLYLLQGLGTTLLITAFAAIIGIILGFLVAVIRSTYDQTGKMKFLNAICNIYLTVIRGTPTMVQLLIMYYVIFASSNLNKVVVAFLAFGINSGAYVAETIRSGIMAVDSGQMEAGRALGFSKLRTMQYIILPQAFKNILPAIGNEMIALLKETSVAGYVAVVDITKAAVQIKNTTYDHINPIILIALVYLVIVMVLTKLLGIFERRLRKSER